MEDQEKTSSKFETASQKSSKKVDDGTETSLSADNIDDESIDLDDLPPDVREALNKLPPGIRKMVSSTTEHQMLMSVMRGGGMPSDPELLKQQDKHQYEIALKGIDATQVDRRETRIHNMAKFKIAAILGGGVIAAIAILAVIAMFNDNTAFVIELIKAIGFVLGGFGGGVIYSKSKDK